MAQAVPGLMTMRVQQSAGSFALCVEDGRMEDLEARKVYQVLPDREANREGYVRVIDLQARNLAQLLNSPAATPSWRPCRAHAAPPRPEIVGAIHEGADQIPACHAASLMRSGARVTSRGRGLREPGSRTRGS